MKTLGAVILTVLLAAGQAALADSDNGTVAGSFLRLPPSAAGAGMGEAGVAVTAGSQAIFVNPAGLATVKGGFASFSHAAWADSLTFDALSAAFNTPYGGVAGLGLRSLSYGKMDAFDNTGAPSGSIAPRDLAVDAGWGADLGGGLAAGFSFKYIDSKIKRSASAFAADAGVTRRVGRAFFGAAIQNAGGGLKFGDESYPLPLNLKLGVGLPYGRNFLGAFDLNITRGSNPWVAVGAKYTSVLRAGLALVLRAGYNTASGDTGGINGFALGFGISLPSLAFDYALRTMGELGPTQHIGISFKWDTASPEIVTPYTPYRAASARARVSRQ